MALARPSTKLAQPLTFEPIRRRRAFEEVCERIRHQLSIGALRPGDKLPAERELAQQFDLSRSALREALRSLEIAGILELRNGPKGGAFVRPGDPTSMTRVIQDLVHLGAISLDDLTEARLLIQTGLVRLACERASKADIDAIGRNIDDTEEMTRQGRHEERLRYATEFYRLLALSTGNEILTILVDALTDILLRFLRGIAGGAPQPGLVESRRRFFRHLKARDAEKATREIEIHLGKLHKLLMQYYAPTREMAGAPRRRIKRPQE
jgi:GntR family transcriptional regulator, transcriptional repressor for pyruvate dehydrogenase complex